MRRILSASVAEAKIVRLAQLTLTFAAYANTCHTTSALGVDGDVRELLSHNGGIRTCLKPLPHTQP